MNSSESVIVRRTRTLGEAQVLAALLESAGIPAQIDHKPWFEHSWPPLGRREDTVAVRVLTGNAEEAERLLAEAREIGASAEEDRNDE